MDKVQLPNAISSIPLAELISLLSAIGERDYSQFTLLEDNFVVQYGTEVWEEYFNFRLLPALDDLSSNWLLEKMVGAEAYQSLRQQIAKGTEQIARGQVTDGKVVFDRLQKKFARFLRSSC